MTTRSIRSATPHLRRAAFAIGGAVLAAALPWTVANSLGVDRGNGPRTHAVGLSVVSGRSSPPARFGNPTPAP
ncbi:hypothetical protein [Kitasatospora sp. NPDC048538]|uniref:hypothetical protein n=1 Tax=unclassified Kitasatospora TaxID=2633591 RepID=UPI0033FFE095